MKKWLIAVMALFVLTACGNKEDTATKDVGKEIEEGTVGFEILGDTIQEATGVPQQEKEKILAAFDEYITAFNEKDLERYKNIISKNAEGFQYEDDIQAVTKVFKQYDINREAQDVTIVKYKENEAQVFANLKTETKEIGTSVELAADGRQVTVFVKEDQWKVSSIYYIGNE